MNRYLSTIALAIAAAWLTPEAHAEKVVIYREGQLVQPQDVAEVLGGTRSLKLLDDEASSSPAPSKTFTAVASTSLTKTSATSSTAARTPRHDAAPSALSLPVRFAFDSAEILPQAREQLDSLAQGIKMLAPERIVTVEGHTDATGTDAYNLALSQARARAVRDYLVQHGIDAARLKTVGYGEERPLEGADPYAPLNRRVQFRGS